jgi:ABC-type uncharacterized transport system substrate-binding protein
MLRDAIVAGRSRKSSTSFVARSFCQLWHHLSDTWRQAYVDVGRISKGEKPSEPPNCQPAKFELVANLKTAIQLGIEVPPMLLSRAEDVIE